MSAVASLYETTVGKKAVMAVTGVILFAFVVGHMMGNLLIYSGPEKLNGYARLLRVEPALLWGVRLLLLGSVLVHIVASVQLTVRNWGRRPIQYYVRHYREADYAARTMVWSGPIIAAFVVYHLLHLTFGIVHPDFIPMDVYHNVVTGFRVWPVSAFYIVAMVLLGFHLYHGLWSLFQTAGVPHAKGGDWRRALATVLSVAIVAGNCSIPIAVLAGIVR